MRRDTKSERGRKRERKNMRMIKEEYERERWGGGCRDRKSKRKDIRMIESEYERKRGIFVHITLQANTKWTQNFQFYRIYFLIY